MLGRSPSGSTGRFPAPIARLRQPKCKENFEVAKRVGRQTGIELSTFRLTTNTENELFERIPRHDRSVAIASITDTPLALPIVILPKFRTTPCSGMHEGSSVKLAQP